MSKRGVLVASDEHQQWLLPWWWERYSLSNDLPVAFVDLGMSEEGRAFCEKRGILLSLPRMEKKWEGPISSQWLEETDYQKEDFQRARQAWFKKPQACLLSPFEETLWLDLDCEVLRPIEGAFSALEEGKEMAIKLMKVPKKVPVRLEFAVEGSTVCNSGVIVFRKNSSLLSLWAKKSLEEADLYWGDDTLLSLLLLEYRDKVSPLPHVYNWLISHGMPSDAFIVHWLGDFGKNYIRTKGGIGRTLAAIWSSTPLSYKN